MKLWLFMAPLLLAQETAKPSDPVPDSLRAEIAIAQRDYLITQKQLEAAFVVVKDKIAQADKFCASQNRSFEPVRLVCTEGKQP